MTAPLACVIGWPITHSRSPLIHRHWLATLGLAGDYIKLAVEPERITTFLAGFADSPYVGGNVTVPHKEAAFAAAEVDEVAHAIGAVNTLWLDQRRLRGTNTDAYGFLANLDDHVAGWDSAPAAAIVLGAGGASRAVIWALAKRGFDPVVVVNRSRDRVEALAARFGKAVRAAGWDELPAWLPSAKIVVNATSLGMVGQAPLPIDLAHLSPEAVVADLVYVPLETSLLAGARARGLRAVDGLGMLLHQAVPGFELWFGRRPAVTPELRALVAADILAR